MAEKINILVVEDNLVMQHYIKAAITANDDYHIQGIVADGLEAVEQARTLCPDIILLDLFLPGIDGIEVIKRVMASEPCPIVVISSELDRNDRDLSFEAQKAGAVDVLPKPKGMQPKDFDAFVDQLSSTIRITSQIKVAGKRLKTRTMEPPSQLPYVLDLDFELLLIGSSTGGPAALYRLLESIAPDFSYSVVVAQHMASGFTEGLCQWLGKTGCKVKIAQNGEFMQPGVVYLAEDDRHIVVGANRRLLQLEMKATFTPSVDKLFLSAADRFNGKMCAAILTGMGSDGTEGMQALHHKGVFTIAESQDSCVIFGMPKAAIASGAIKSILHLDEIAAILAR